MGDGSCVFGFLWAVRGKETRGGGGWKGNTERWGHRSLLFSRGLLLETLGNGALAISHLKVIHLAT